MATNSGGTNNPNTIANNKTAPTGSLGMAESLLKATALPDPYRVVRGGGKTPEPLSAAAAARRKAGA